MDQSKISNHLHPAVITAMLLTLFYWSYLGLTAQTIIFHDSFAYQDLGNQILNKSWQNYFVTGPNREPLYPILVSLSMRIASRQHVDYLAVQIIFQTAILLLTQFLSARMLKKLKISDGLSVLTVVYLGCSPAILNSGLILYSEILTYPLVLWLVLRAGKAWTGLKTASLGRLIVDALFFAAASLAITFTKGGFEIIVPFLLVPYILLAIKTRRARDKKTLSRIFIFLAVFLLAFEVPIVTYKMLNKIYNGVYALTDRGSFALYGNTARRMEPLSGERFRTALAYTAGPDVCIGLYGNACAPWGFLPSDLLGRHELEVLRNRGLNGQQINDACIRDSVKEILKNPLQYVLLTALEGMKMFFWESPQIYCVVYPDIVTNLYDNRWFRYPLRYLTAAASLLALLYVMRKLIRKGRSVFEISDERTSLELYLAMTVVAYIFFHAFFFMSPRYALPLIPLFLVLIADLVQDLRTNS